MSYMHIFVAEGHMLYISHIRRIAYMRCIRNMSHIRNIPFRGGMDTPGSRSPAKTGISSPVFGAA